ncbi:MAG: hypothetical protein JWO17_811 [Actinomycetia bacterium]|nr:hypothetical protein [Actinomycetes bacterium]
MRGRLFIGVSVLLVGITAPALAAVAAAPAAPGGIGVRLLAVPGASSANPQFNGYITGVVVPGTTIRRRIAVENSTRGAVSVAVYPGAASIRRGVFAFAPRRRRNDLARWTAVSSAVLHLPAGGLRFVTVTVSVPRFASPGERHAVVWAELAAPATSGVRLINRVGIRLYLTVGAGGSAPVDFTIGRLKAARSTGGAPLVQATLRNSGSRTLAIAGSLTLSNGPGGTNAGPFPAALTRALSPGGSAQLRVQLDPRLPLGPWHARLRLHSATLKRDAAATLSFPRAQPVGAAAPAGSNGGWTRQLLRALVLFDLAGAVAVVLLAANKNVGLLRGRIART